MRAKRSDGGTFVFVADGEVLGDLVRLFYARVLTNVVVRWFGGGVGGRKVVGMGIELRLG